MPQVRKLEGQVGGGGVSPPGKEEGVAQLLERLDKATHRIERMAGPARG